PSLNYCPNIPRKRSSATSSIPRWTRCGASWSPASSTAIHSVRGDAGSARACICGWLPALRCRQRRWTERRCRGRGLPEHALAGATAAYRFPDRDQHDGCADADQEREPGDAAVGVVVAEVAGHPGADQATQCAEGDGHNHADVLLTRHDETRHQTNEGAHDDGEDD